MTQLSLKFGCIRCGDTHNEDGSEVLWKCESCGNLVCRKCAMTIPFSTPTEYYHDTLCSEECWKNAGCPED